MKGRKSEYVNERMLLISVQKCAWLNVCVFEKVPTSESRSFSEISYWNKRTDVGGKKLTLEESLLFLCQSIKKQAYSNKLNRHRSIPPLKTTMRRWSSCYNKTTACLLTCPTDCYKSGTAAEFYGRLGIAPPLSLV